MADVYEVFQGLYERLEKRERRRPVGAAMATARVASADPNRIDELRKLKDEFQRIAAGLEQALFDLQNDGRTDQDLSLALSIANHCAAGAAQLLVAAIDRSEEVRASSQAMGQSTAQLATIKTETEELIKDLDQVTSVLKTAGKVLQLIKA